MLVHLRSQTLPLEALAELVITHDGLTDADRERLERAAGRKLTLVLLKPGTGYYESKNVGFEATTAEVVAFGDSDCWPVPCWLESLFRPIESEGFDVAAGRTTYRDDVLGIAATTIDFMYFDSPLAPGCTRNFYANNVAFRRQTFDQRRYQRAEGVYRGHCQVLGLRLQREGVVVRFAPAARTTHRFPDSVGELVKLRMLRGEDTTELTPHLARAYLPRSLERIGSTTLGTLAVLSTRFAFSVRSIGKQEMPAVHGLRYLATVGTIAGISLIDTAGAMARATGIFTIGDRDHAESTVNLSYHDDVDELASTTPSETKAEGANALVGASSNANARYQAA